ncbi:MAG: ABC transporter permease subunit [Clostridia bacterium]|nr:ABC transporter permease subunit [Clostridia bacterium]MBQ8393234.1 ABC transporter permease subunit [Clostridia bacterium]
MAKNKEYTTVAADGTVLVHMAPKKTMKLSLTQRKALAGWLLVLPFVLGLVLVYGPLLFYSIISIFWGIKVEQSGIVYDRTVGFDHIRWAFEGDKYFLEALYNGFMDLLIQVPAIIIFSLFMAIILNQKMRGRAAFRAIFFLPVILSIGIIDSIDTSAALSMNAIAGGIDDGTSAMEGGSSFISMMDLNMLFENVQIGGSFLSIASELVNSIFDVVSRSGVQMLIFLSGLQSISPAIYESCQIDGASAWETFWKVTLPMISPMILVNSIYTLIDAFTASGNGVISHIFQDIGTEDNPTILKIVDEEGNTIVRHLSANSLSTTEMWIYVLFIAILVVVVALLMKAFVFYQKRD